MDTLTLTHVPVAHTGMLIRRPAGDVFEALVNPSITSKFWFTNGSGRLETGKRVRWDWKMYDASADVLAIAIEPNKRIEIQWPRQSGPTTVEWRFEALRDDATFVDVTESGFQGSADDLVEYVADSTQGFSLVLAGMKAFLEHGVQLNLTADRFPKGHDVESKRGDRNMT